ncbi:MAG: hypothetical protein M3R17_00905 [Bacteroidota bacterium]|nr:hypothetical protein [Bacteroidota bacterium]
MTNYNIKRNREPLTEADVAKGQNFDAFLKAYSGAKVPFYKTGTFGLSVVALGVVIAVGSYFLVSNDDKNTAPTAFVQPALNGIDVADTVFTMDAAEGGEFIYNTGSLIRVPEGGFLDSAGNVAKGKVEIRYREFHNTADIFLAGIPMTYDSAGTKYHFESAGMLEITAWQNGKPLKANPSAPVKVAMASNSADTKFNVYYLDTVKKNWDFVAKDKAVVVGFTPDTSVKVDPKTNLSASVAPPVEIKKADKAKPSFVIGFEPAEFPELASYDGVRFQVNEDKTPYNREDKKIKWEDVSIERNRDGVSYTVTFTHGPKTSTYVTDVVVNAEDYAAAKKVYDAKYAAYQSTLKAINDKNASEDKALEAKLLNADAQRIFKNDTAMRAALARRQMANVSNAKEDMVVREFIIQDFGVWNSDCPSSLPEGETLFVKLLDSRTKKALEINHVILVEKGKNAIYTYYAADLANFKFNPNAENLLWAVTKDGKLAVCSNDDLQNLVGKKQANLTMTVSAEDLKGPEQARIALGI